MSSDGVVRIDFHVHTNRSPEGISGLAETIARAKIIGLDGIAVTDHNRLLTRRIAAEISKIHNFLVIGGIEGGDLVRHKSRQSNAHRHWIGLNIDEPPSGGDVQEIVESIREEGGLSIAPHPYARNGFRNYGELKFDAVESLNGTRKDGEIDAKGLAKVGGTVDRRLRIRWLCRKHTGECPKGELCTTRLEDAALGDSKILRRRSWKIPVRRAM